VSKKEILVIPYKPTQIGAASIGLRIHYAKIRFANYTFATNNKEQIDFLRNHVGYGTKFTEIKASEKAPPVTAQKATLEPRGSGGLTEVIEVTSKNSAIAKLLELGASSDETRKLMNNAQVKEFAEVRFKIVFPTLKVHPIAAAA
jgi:hypothetical protein